MAYFALALALAPPLPMTEAAREAAPRAVATTAPAATLAVVLAARMALPAMDPLVAGFLDLVGFGAGFAAALAADGTTFFGAALPKTGFASLERAAIAGPAPVFDWTALRFAGAGFLVAIGRFPDVGKICRSGITTGKS
ncbi:conserved exported hypothetical protein [Mesorhizobium metallidurans STM 2683]|uniref:Uncharacterized protein n=1 Tax=Mesorhizobium metallidurans STM 2683 TaxID=1297569 RepID=M5EH89_9HYPH|nr:conserved exported hypothetical protein [Mesorhizobium metallidurans STM 2683]